MPERQTKLLFFLGVREVGVTRTLLASPIWSRGAARVQDSSLGRSHPALSWLLTFIGNTVQGVRRADTQQHQQEPQALGHVPPLRNDGHQLTARFYSPENQHNHCLHFVPSSLFPVSSLSPPTSTSNAPLFLKPLLPPLGLPRPFLPPPPSLIRLITYL